MSNASSRLGLVLGLEAIRMLEQDPRTNLHEVTRDILDSVGSRHRIRAKNHSQRNYVEMIRANDIVFFATPFDIAAVETLDRLL